MSERKDNKRIKFSADNVDQYEAQFRLEHDRAMGYIPKNWACTATRSAIERVG